MTIEYIDDHVEKALDRILEQYKNKSKVRGLITAIVKPLQGIEDAAQPLLTLRHVNTAVGAQLDGVGQIVGLARELEQDDEDYRALIKAKIVQNLNNGTPEEVIAAAKFFLNTTEIWFTENYPAEVDIQTTEEIEESLRPKLRKVLEKFLPSGVALGIFGQYDVERPFLFDSGEGFGFIDGESTYVWTNGPIVDQSETFTAFRTTTRLMKHPTLDVFVGYDNIYKKIKFYKVKNKQVQLITTFDMGVNNFYFGTSANQFTSVNFLKTNVTATDNVIAGVDGTVNGGRIVEDFSIAVHKIGVDRYFGTIGLQYTCQMYMKKLDRDFVAMQFTATRFAGVTKTIFNLANGTIVSEGANTIAKIEPHPTAAGWYLCSITSTCTTDGAGYCDISLMSADGSTDFYEGTGAGVYLNNTVMTDTAVNFLTDMKWSPDGTRLLYVCANHNFKMLYVPINPTNLTITSISVNYSPSLNYGQPNPTNSVEWVNDNFFLTFGGEQDFAGSAENMKAYYYYMDEWSAYWEEPYWNDYLTLYSNNTVNHTARNGENANPVIAMGLSAAPFVVATKINTDDPYNDMTVYFTTHTPNINPPGAVKRVIWSPDFSYLIALHDASPYISFYSYDYAGAALTKITTPAAIASVVTATVSDLQFHSSNGLTRLVISLATTQFIFDVTGAGFDTFTPFTTVIGALVGEPLSSYFFEDDETLVRPMKGSPYLKVNEKFEVEKIIDPDIGGLLSDAF